MEGRIHSAPGTNNMHKVLVWSVAAGFVAAAACGKSEKKQDPAPTPPPAGSGSQAEPAGSAAGSAAPAPEGPAIEYGWFRGTIDLEGDHSVPFLVNLPKPG